MDGSAQSLLHIVLEPAEKKIVHLKDFMKNTPNLARGQKNVSKWKQLNYGYDTLVNWLRLIKTRGIINKQIKLGDENFFKKEVFFR